MHAPDNDEAYYRATEANMQQILDSESMSSLPIDHFYGSETRNIPEEEFFIESEVQTDGDLSRTNHLYLHGSAKSQEDLSLIISSRDETIEKLEGSLNQQLNSMQDMQGEMTCLMEKQRTKAKKVSSTHKFKEENLDYLVVSMRKKLQANELRSKKQDKNLKECKLYIQELADELEKVLKIITRAQDGGFLQNCN